MRFILLPDLLPPPSRIPTSAASIFIRPRSRSARIDPSKEGGRAGKRGHGFRKRFQAVSKLGRASNKTRCFTRENPSWLAFTSRIISALNPALTRGNDGSRGLSRRISPRSFPLSLEEKREGGGKKKKKKISTTVNRHGDSVDHRFRSVAVE